MKQRMILHRTGMVAALSFALMACTAWMEGGLAQERGNPAGGTLTFAQLTADISEITDNALLKRIAAKYTIVCDLDVATGVLRRRFNGEQPFRARNGETLVLRLASDEETYDLVIFGTDGRPAATVKRGIKTTTIGHALSPDGQMAAWGETAEDGDIYTFVADRNGRLLARIRAMSPEDWTPDNRLVLKADERLGKGCFYLTNGAFVPKRIGISPDDLEARVSPDGKRIAFVRGNDAWVMNLDGSHPVQVTSGFIADAPAWSPDGKWLAVRKDAGTGHFGEWTVYLVSPDKERQGDTLFLKRADGRPVQVDGGMNWR